MNETSSLQQALPNKLQAVLNDSPFTVFTRVVDYGYFSWTPKGPYKKLQVVTKSDISNGLDCNGKPAQVLSIDSLKQKLKSPLKFKRLHHKETAKNLYPYDPSYLVPLHVAIVDRGINLDDIHFKFGGSTMHMLSTQSLQGNEYRAQLIPGTKIVLIQKFEEYKINFSAEGFQFENFCTTGNLQPMKIEEMKSSIHLQQITILDKWNILVSAECDGMDPLHDDPIEMKCTTKTTRNEKVAFQMISSGSLSLYGAEKDNKTASLRGVHCIALEKILKDVFDTKEKQTLRRVELLQKNFIHGLESIREAVDQGVFDNGRLMTIQFSSKDHKLKLNPVSLLPSDDVVKELLQPKA